jgi:hypothetical protein
MFRYGRAGSYCVPTDQVLHVLVSVYCLLFVLITIQHIATISLSVSKQVKGIDLSTKIKTYIILDRGVLMRLGVWKETYQDLITDRRRIFQSCMI